MDNMEKVEEEKIMTKKKEILNKRMSFVEHLEEMRWVLLKCIVSVMVFTILSYVFSKQFVNFLTAPYYSSIGKSLIALGPFDILMLRINLSVTMGVIISFPVIIYQFWKFIAPGLLEREKNYVPWIIFFTIISFLIGASFAYYLFIPLALKFAAQSETLNVIMTVSIDKYVTVVTRLLIAFGLAFELPILSMFLAKIGFLTETFMKSMRGYAIVLLFVGAAILTPPSWETQIMLALPLLALYEISIWIVKIVNRKDKREIGEDEYEDEEENDYGD